MARETIRIIKEAEEEARNIVMSAEAEAEEILNSAKIEAEESKKELSVLLERECDQKTREARKRACEISKKKNAKAVERSENLKSDLMKNKEYAIEAVLKKVTEG